MCGRYATTADPATLAAELDAVDETDGSWDGPDYNVAPTTPVTTLVARHDRGDASSPVARRLRTMRWGLVPSYTKDPGKGAPLFNARAETLAEKPAFRTSLRYKRALVPMDGWYEWRVDEPGDTAAAPRGGRSARSVVRTPYLVARGDGARTMAAALWSVWHDRDRPDARPLLSVSIVTTDSSGPLASLHDRMPLVLGPDAWDAWLSPDDAADPALLQPDPELVAQMDVRRVSSLVNNVRNNGPELWVPDAGGPDTADTAGQLSLL